MITTRSFHQKERTGSISGGTHIPAVGWRSQSPVDANPSNASCNLKETATQLTFDDGLATRRPHHAKITDIPDVDTITRHHPVDETSSDTSQQNVPNILVQT